MNGVCEAVNNFYWGVTLVPGPKLGGLTRRNAATGAVALQSRRCSGGGGPEFAAQGVDGGGAFGVLLAGSLALAQREAVPIDVRGETLGVVGAGM